ncbi:GTPase-activating protein [Oryzomonas rubra]|uniref:GTPase-activating protein n=1 Tax=Oryzomonas rubra TaxID=2509454 RepID=A0A5A9XKK7_9BACT|nr:GTPase-activating protein [Oryzomonas rubra]KAA0893300.1 GTPase-activating protein [Oryzomonas rubra]
MFLLPKGNPLFENLAVGTLKLPEVLAKLSTGNFTGYASFVFQESTITLVFEAGKVVSALHEEENGNRQTGLEALTALCHLMVGTSGGTLNVYKLSKDLTRCIHALLQGEILYKAQELKLVDIKALLEKIGTDRMSGCLRIYTDERSTIIFYKDGVPLGFFHDGSQDIETSSSESQKIAGLPGAKIDLFTTQGVEHLMGLNLLEIINIQNIWETAVALQQSEINRINTAREERERKNIAGKLEELEDQVKTIVVESVGRVGRGIVDKELNDQGGNSCLLDETNVVKFLAGVERSAKLLISATSLKVMMEQLSRTITAAKSGH